MKAISINKLSKKYTINYERPMLLRNIFIPFRKGESEEFWALKNISLDLEQGETSGIIGENGAGKSTLLKILAGVTAPTNGNIKTNGRVASLLELGAGFHPHLTGRENIYLNGYLLGMTRQEITRKLHDIIMFSELGKFINAPLRTYSSGMSVRLGFSIAIHSNPDILLIDEVLAVGDESFQRKCYNKIAEFKAQRKSILIISHDLAAIRNLCRRVYWLKEGQIQKEGSESEVITAYLEDIGRTSGIITMQNNKLMTVFERGKLLIYWDGQELTKNLGGHTSFFSHQLWQDSSQAKWEVKEASENKAVLFGTWQRLPVIQKWEIEIVENNKIRWNINTRSSQIDIENINLMLSDLYKKWHSSTNTGHFPESFHANFWQRINQFNGKTNKIGVLNAPLSANIYLENISKDISFSASIFNTDLTLGSRVLQYTSKGNKKNNDTNIEIAIEPC